MTFADNLDFGQQRQDLAADLLAADGWVVKRLKAQQDVTDGRGPHLLGVALLTLPDLEIRKLGVSLALEWKAKRKITFGKLSSELEHGIDRDDWESLRRYTREMEIPVFLGIDEVAVGGRMPCRDLTEGSAHVGVNSRLAMSIDRLRPRFQNDGNGHDMAYFPRSQFGPWLDVLNRSIGVRDNHRRRS